jgi:hypothetical protein
MLLEMSSAKPDFYQHHDPKFVDGQWYTQPQVFYRFAARYSTHVNIPPHEGQNLLAGGTFDIYRASLNIESVYLATGMYMISVRSEIAC